MTKTIIPNAMAKFDKILLFLTIFNGHAVLLCEIIQTSIPKKQHLLKDTSKI